MIHVVFSFCFLTLGWGCLERRGSMGTRFSELGLGVLELGCGD